MNQEKRYDQIGISYNSNRKADPAVIVKLLELLSLPKQSSIADIGAGTGNYSNSIAENGYFVKAIEPSAVMRAQSIPNDDVKWYEGFAEKIPLDEYSVEGIISVLAIHHFSSFDTAVTEMYRICTGGPIVFLTIDPRKGEKFWFETYFPSIYKKLFETFPPINEICNILARIANGKIEVIEFPLPQETTDYTMHSGWNHPEIYLEPNFRQSMSGFSLASSHEIDPGVSNLRADLETGTWDKKYGELRKLKEYDLGFRFIKLTVNKGLKSTLVSC